MHSRKEEGGGEKRESKMCGGTEGGKNKRFGRRQELRYNTEKMGRKVKKSVVERKVVRRR